MYGTLRALPLLAWALTGDPKQTQAVRRLASPAIVKGYARYAVRHCDYPAAVAVADPDASVDGYLLRLESASQRRKLDDFEGETYRVTPVVALVQPEAEERLEPEAVNADMYVWDGDEEQLARDTPWDLDVFVRERLEDWIELFAGMELVGELDEDPGQ